MEAFIRRMDLIDAFVAANPAKLSTEELEIISSWHDLVFGRFVALRQLKKHMVLLSDNDEPTAYAVTGLNDPIDRVIGRPLPAMIETVLLPFRGKIIYDGVVVTINATFGSGTLRSFEEHFRVAKTNGRFFSSLLPLPADSTESDLDRTDESPVSTTSPLLGQVIAMTDAFCKAHLTEEYAALCRKLAENLAAKRPSPLLRGKLETWACGIVRTIGWVNFLDDRQQSPHMKLPVIDRAFGVAESTGQGKSKAIRQWLAIRQFDHRWMLPSRWESGTLVWVLQDSRGLMIDIRKQPAALQRAAFAQGLIPYVPADRAPSL